MATNLGIINSSRTSQFGEGIYIKYCQEGARDVSKVIKLDAMKF